MEHQGVDLSKRRFLTGATVVVGGIGTGALAVPFLSYLAPSEKAKAAGAPVEVDIAALQPGAMVKVLWRGAPIWVVRRTPEMLASLKAITPRLADAENTAPQQPEYIKGEARALKPEYMVLTGRCTHLGCAPSFRPERNAPDVDANWEGGFFCPCHGSKFDLSGRVFAGVPAPKNLEVPKHRYINDTKIMIGEDPIAA